MSHILLLAAILAVCLSCADDTKDTKKPDTTLPPNAAIPPGWDGSSDFRQNSFTLKALAR